MIGSKLGHYQITALLGEGGMGEVYRARDEKLGREVALKVLPAKMAGDSARLERFQREARAVAALNHPNVVTLYSVEEDQGTHFLTMELVEGRTLAAIMSKRGLALGEFFRLAIAMANAMAAAHGRGITHRDLKPANVMVTREGQVKILDFGLAKLTEAVDGGDLTQLPTEALTQDGLIVGTVPYMSPEQIEGRPLDHRTDIFSLGVLFYEMIIGARPFKGETQPALMSSILRDVPPSVVEMRQELPRHLGRILDRCLEKDPGLRYQSASSLAYELSRLEKEHEKDSLAGPVGAAMPPERASGISLGKPSSADSSGVAAVREKSIAVLPFVNRSSNAEDQYFSDGLSEELINALSKLDGIRVTARSSAFQFRGQEIDPREVGRKLGVDAVLEGSVRIAGQRLRITTELVGCDDGLQLWSERFDGEMKDIFDTQDEIVRSIVGQFEIELGSGDAARPAHQRTENLDAYHLLLKARHYAADFWEPGLVKAIECLEQAIELDPTYSLAHAELSFCYLIRSIFGSLSGAEAFPEVRRHALRALELDPNIADGHRAYGIYLSWHDLDWAAGEKELLRAIELDPDNVWSHFYYAGVLSTARRYDDIRPHVERMKELDPLNPLVNAHVSLFLFYAGRGDEAVREAEKSLELFPDYWFLFYEMSLFRWRQREARTAITLMRRAIEMTNETIPFLSCFLAAMYFFFGHQEEGERTMARVDEMSAKYPVSTIGPTVVEVVRGNRDEAIRWLEKGRAEHDTLFVWVRAFCEMQDLLDDQEIRVVMERLGLP